MLQGLQYSYYPHELESEKDKFTVISTYIKSHKRHSNFGIVYEVVAGTIDMSSSICVETTVVMEGNILKGIENL